MQTEASHYCYYICNPTHVLGEFGVVFKAHLINWQGDKLPKAVAVKTVKGTFLAIKMIIAVFIYIYIYGKI